MCLSNPQHSPPSFNQTYTMFGAPPQKPSSTIHHEDGLLPRALAHLLHHHVSPAHPTSSSPPHVTSLECSCYEIHNELALDLLSPHKARALAVRRDVVVGAAVEGLTWHPVTPGNVGEIQRLLRKAVESRHTRGHQLNARSSRSHCVVTFRCESGRRRHTETNAQLNGQYSSAKAADHTNNKGEGSTNTEGDSSRFGG